MIGRCNVWINGQGLAEIDETIFVTDIAETMPVTKINTAEYPMGGTRFLRASRSSLSVSVVFAIREYSTERRKDVCARVRAWARSGGWLSISDRPNQRLHVRCAGLPSLESSQRWTNTLSVEFTAYESPWWENDLPTRSTASTPSTTANLSITPPGDAEECLLDAEIKATDAVGTLTITVGQTVFRFSDLGMNQGDTLRIDRDEQNLLRMMIGTRSVMDKRTADSSDELQAIPGKPTTITVTSSGRITATFQTRGRWL